MSGVPDAAISAYVGADSRLRFVFLDHIVIRVGRGRLDIDDIGLERRPDSGVLSNIDELLVDLDEWG